MILKIKKFRDGNRKNLYASRFFYHSSYGLSKIIHRHLVLIGAGYGCIKNWVWVNGKAKREVLELQRVRFGQHLEAIFLCGWAVRFLSPLLLLLANNSFQASIKGVSTFTIDSRALRSDLILAKVN